MPVIGVEIKPSTMHVEADIGEILGRGFNSPRLHQKRKPRMRAACVFLYLGHRSLDAQTIPRATHCRRRTNPAQLDTTSRPGDEAETERPRKRPPPRCEATEHRRPRARFFVEGHR